MDEKDLLLLNIEFTKLREESIIERPEDIDHVFLVFIEPLPSILVAEENEGEDLGLFDQPLDDVAIFVDDSF